MLLHKFLCHCLCRSWERVFSIVARLLAGQLRNCDLIFLRNKIFLVFLVSRLALGPTQLSVEWVAGAISLGVKWLEQGFGHICPSNSEVMNDWQYSSIPIFLHGMHRAALPVTVFIDFIDEVKQGCSAIACGNSVPMTHCPHRHS